MKTDDELIISLTTDADAINTCALMMAASDPWITLGMNYEQCIVAFDGPCKEVYVARYENKIAGFVILQVCGSFKGYIQTLCVSEEFRGRGFGKEILQFCEKRILQISPNIFICVSSFNKGAIRLYESFGFKLVGELPDFIKEGFTELLLRKSVSPIIGYKFKIKNDTVENA
jgi:[ribosomal protein S18]-alanine N-acetyltransferase